MTSQKDRVIRVRTAPDTTMPEHRSRRVFTWVSMSEGNSCTMCVLLFLHDERETSERCLVLFEANPCSNSDRSVLL